MLAGRREIVLEVKTVLKCNYDYTKIDYDVTLSLKMCFYLLHNHLVMRLLVTRR